MTGFLDGLLAILVAAVLNLVVIYLIRARAPQGEYGFLVRVYLWTVLIRYSLAVLLNVFVTDSAVAAAFWGDSGSYDTGGYQLSLRWSGEPITSAYMSTSLSGYGWVYFVGSIYYVFGRNQLLGPTAERAHGRTNRSGHLFDRRAALRPCSRSVGGRVHGVLSADGVLVDRDVQGSRDPSLHSRGHVCGSPASRQPVRAVDRHVRRGGSRSDHAALLHRVLRHLRRARHVRVRHNAAALFGWRSPMAVLGLLLLAR